MFDVITFGTATRDAFVRSEAFKIIESGKFITGKAECFPLGSKIEIPEIVFTTGGGATNAAVTFARQGLKTACFSVVGNDVSGKAVIEELKKEKVAVDFFVKNNKFNTAYSILFLTSFGERTIFVYRGASEHWSRDDLLKFKNKLKAKWFYLAPLGGESAKHFEFLVNFAKKNNIKVACNLSKAQIEMGLKKIAPILKKLDVLILNQEEAAYLVGIDYKKENEIFKKLDEIVDGIVVMTKGPEGASISDGKNRWEVGVYKEKKSVDRTGAGDAFGSGFIAGIIKYGNIEKAIKLAGANATSVIEYIGAKKGILAERDYKKRNWGKLKVKKQNIEFRI